MYINRIFKIILYMKCTFITFTTQISSKIIKNVPGRFLVPDCCCCRRFPEDVLVSLQSVLCVDRPRPLSGLSCCSCSSSCLPPVPPTSLLVLQSLPPPLLPLDQLPALLHQLPREVLLLQELLEAEE